MDHRVEKPACSACGPAQAWTAGRPRGPELPLVQDLRTDHGLAVRLYRPSLDLWPTVLYLHGGGFVIGDLESHDGLSAPGTDLGRDGAGS